MAKIGLDPSPCNIIQLRTTMGINGPGVSESNLHFRSRIAYAELTADSDLIKSYSEETWHPFLPAFGASSYNLQHSEHAPIH